MKILFLTLSLPDLGSDKGGFYADLIKQMAQKGHEVFAICNNDGETQNGFHEEGKVSVIRVKVPFLKRNTSIIRKGIGALFMNPCYVKAFKKYLKKESFDYIIIPTPPATLVDVVKRIKGNAKLYLILRDIQPECADRKPSQSVLEREDVYDECKKTYSINPIARHLLYKKSQELYKISDLIGCMSPDNIEFVKTITPYADETKLRLLPNWYSEPIQKKFDATVIRKKYDLGDKFIAIYGGNIGPQQAVWNIAQLAKMNLEKKDVFFLIVGRGTHKHVLEEMARKDHISNMIFLKYMPKEDYEAILQTADLGLISLDEKYKVPTCPSKIIGYMAMAKPVLAMFNKGSDYGEFYIDNPGCGLWSVDLDHNRMQDNFEWFYSHPKERKQMGVNGYNYYKEHFSVERICELLDNQLKSISM